MRCIVENDLLLRLTVAETVPVPQVEPEELCHVCSVYTGSETLVCGVCYRVFHEGCLAKIGQWSGPPDILASSSMWSCHQCVSLCLSFHQHVELSSVCKSVCPSQ